jgi:hypothetical protein
MIRSGVMPLSTELPKEWWEWKLRFAQIQWLEAFTDDNDDSIAVSLLGDFVGEGSIISRGVFFFRIPDLNEEYRSRFCIYLGVLMFDPQG